MNGGLQSPELNMQTAARPVAEKNLMLPIGLAEEEGGACFCKVSFQIEEG